MLQRRVSDTTPDVIEVELYFWNLESNWSNSADNVGQIRFKIIGKSMGQLRWRPHLVQYKDKLPTMTNKEYTSMLKTLREEISLKIGLDCVQISVDLLDDISEGEDDY